MIQISRLLEKKIEDRLFKNKIIIIYGARQVGKTTLSKKIVSKFGADGRYLNCELISVQEGMKDLEAEKIKKYLGNYKIVILDEAQYIDDIGKKLKIMIDTYPEIQLIATGSSSFDLAGKVSEPLTGRTYTFLLNPLSAGEIAQDVDRFGFNAKLESLLRFGSYPEVYFLTEKEAIERLNEISADYLYKDILRVDGIKKSSLIKNLLQLLAMQVSSEVSYQELAEKLGVSRLTVQKYIDILEQSFVIFQLRAFARNQRNEISKSVKIYFNDLGIRNGLIQNFNPLDIRDDVGALWENFCIAEKRKANAENDRYVNSFFWRTYSQKEIDYVEEAGGKISGYEFKWNSLRKYSPPREFMETYKADVKKIGKENVLDFLS